MSLEEVKSTEKVDAMLALYNKYDILTLSNALKINYTNLAYANLEQIEVLEANKMHLYALADKLMHRSR